jgi:hypothetical protein
MSEVFSKSTGSVYSFWMRSARTSNKKSPDDIDDGAAAAARFEDSSDALSSELLESSTEAFGLDEDHSVAPTSRVRAQTSERRGTRAFRRLCEHHHAELPVFRMPMMSPAHGSSASLRS